MKVSQTLHALTMLAVVIVCVGVFSALMQPVTPDHSKRPPNARAQSVRDAVNSYMSRDDFLKGLRVYDGKNIRGRVRFHGAAFTLQDSDDPSTFVPYAFQFDGTEFTTVWPINIPNLDAFFGRHGARYPIRSATAASGCIDPRPRISATASGIGLRDPVVCRLSPMTPDGGDAAIGFLYPVEADLPLADGDLACREEVRHWFSLAEFEDTTVAICAIVDRSHVRPPPGVAERPQQWMDVILYQRRGTALLNMRGERRNFHHVVR